MSKLEPHSAQNFSSEDIIIEMNVITRSHVSKNSQKRNRMNSLDTAHQIDPTETCFEICDKKSCQISQTCIQKSELHQFERSEYVYLPKLGVLPQDEPFNTVEDNSIATKSVFKNLNRFLFTSFFIHAALISSAIALVVLIEPFVTKDTGSLNSNTALIDVVMIDTNSMAVLPINQVKVTEEFAQQLSLLSADLSTETSPTNLSEQRLTQEVLPSSNLKPIENMQATKNVEPFSPVKTNEPAIQNDIPTNIQKKADSTQVITKPIEHSNSHSELTMSQPTVPQNIPNQKEPISSNVKNTSDLTQVKPANTKNKDTLKTESQIKSSSSLDKKTTDNVADKPPKKKKATTTKPEQMSATSAPAGILNESTNSSLASDTATQNKTYPASNSQNAKPIKRTYPNYPQRAAALNQEGTVTVKFDVNNNGKVINIRIINSDPSNIFDKEVKRALRDWVYERIPTQDIIVTFSFKMSGINLN